VQDGDTALFVAANADITQALMGAGAHVNLQDEVRQTSTAVSIAGTNGCWLFALHMYLQQGAPCISLQSELSLAACWYYSA
jgi:hypothetical protein